MRRHPSMLLMSAIAALLASGALLGFAQNEGAITSPMDHLHHSHSADFTKVPERARSRMNPLVNDPDAPIAGRKLFEQHCAECHGDTAAGSRRAPSLRAEEVQQASPGTFFWDSDQWSSAPGHAGVVETARTATLANRHLREILDALTRGRTGRRARSCPLVAFATCGPRNLPEAGFAVNG